MVPSVASRLAAVLVVAWSGNVTSMTVAEPRLELGGRSLGDDLAVIDDDDPVREPVRFLEVLGGEEHRGAAVDELFDDVPQLGAPLRVEAGRGLVEEEDGRLVDERRGEVESAAHPARVGAHEAVGGVDQVEPFEQLRAASPDRGRGLMGQPADQGEVLAGGEVLVDGGVLAGEADHRSDPPGVRDDVDAQHRGAAPIGSEQGGEDPHRGGLPRPVRAEQPEDGARRDLQ